MWQKHGVREVLREEVNVQEIKYLKSLVGVTRMDIELGMKKCVPEFK